MKKYGIISMVIVCTLLLALCLPNIHVLAQKNTTGSISNDYETISGEFISDAEQGFKIIDNKLVSLSANGEGKAIVKEELNSCKSVSVDIYPGDTGVINAGIYLGASGAGSAQDEINALGILIQSDFTGWSDAANRIDIIVGNFPTWTEYTRILSETGRNNALFTNGEKQPLNLKVDIEGKNLKVTLSLVNNPDKSVTMQYEYTGDYDLENGKVGVRTQYNDSSFDNLKIESGKKNITYTFDNEKDMDAFDCYHSSWSDGIVARKNNSVVVHKTASFTNGTLTADLMVGNSGEGGIIFGADREANSYYLLRLTLNRYVELVKVVDGTETVLAKGVLSAGYNSSNKYTVDIVKDGNKIYCYLHYTDEQTICYASCEDKSALDGMSIGLWAKTANVVFSNLSISDDVDIRKSDVLIFGHSYTELWFDYKTDFPEYQSIDDIGIGGSIAKHWEELVDEVVSYQPKLGIYDIGINDLSIGLTPLAVIDSTEKTLLEIKEELPDFEAVLISVSHCPTRAHITDEISETNALMRNLAASYDWVHYAEAEYMFCSDASNPTSTIASYFTDGLHPSKEGYKLMADSIRLAIKGEKQPILDTELAQAIFERAKAAKFASLGIYSEHAYNTENWEKAEPYYNSAVDKISACKTKEELNTLDLSTEIEALDKIANKSIDIVTNLSNTKTRQSMGASDWSKKSEHTISMDEFGYTLDKTATYDDFEAVFSVTNNNGDIKTGGILLRTSMNENTGLDGYLINYVSDMNYMQVYYINNCYNKNSTPYELTYIGGVAYGTYGDVVDEDFHVRIEGDKLYLSRFEDYKLGKEPLTVIDLTYNGKYDVYETGFFGEIAWTSNVGYDLSLKYFAGKGEEPKTNSDKNYVVVPLEMPEGFTVCHHAYENTMDYLNKALAAGAQNVELDVNFWPDGTPVNYHDANPAQGTGVALEEFFKVLKDEDCLIQLDLKSGAHLDNLIALVEEYGLTERCWAASAALDFVLELIEKDSDIECWINYTIDVSRLNDKGYAQSIADYVIECGGVGINVQYGSLSKCIVDTLHENGLKVSAWTVDSKEAQRKILEMRVDNLTTNNPNTVKEMLAARTTDDVEIIYNSGSMGKARNSTDFVHAVLNDGGKALQIDISFRADNTPVANNSNQTTAEGVGTELGDLFEILSGTDCTIMFNIVISGNAQGLEKLVKLVEEYGLQNQVNYQTNATDLAEIKKASSEPEKVQSRFTLAIDKGQYNNKQYCQSIANTLLQGGATGLNTHYSCLSECLVDTLHENGLIVSAYTVSDETNARNVLALGADYISTNSAEVLRKLILISIPENLTVNYNAGSMGKTRNSVDFVYAVLADGGNCLQIDISFRADNTPVAYSSNQTTPEGVGTELDALFEVLSGTDCTIMFNIMMSGNAQGLEKLVKLVEEYGLQNQVNYQTNAADLIAIKGASSEPNNVQSRFTLVIDKTQYNNKQYCQSIANTLLQGGATGINIQFGSLSRCLVDTLHENGLIVATYTLDNETDQRKMVNYGVDYMTTNKAAAFRSIAELTMKVLSQ